MGEVALSLSAKISFKIKMLPGGGHLIDELVEQNDLEILHFGKKYQNSQKVSNALNSITQIDKTSVTAAEPVTPYAEHIDFIEKPAGLVRVMDNHNFYEAAAMPQELLNAMPIGLLTKLWINISRVVREQ